MNRPRLLFLNNFRSPDLADGLDRHFDALGFDVEVRHAWRDRIPTSASGYAATFLSGSEISPWDDHAWVRPVSDLMRSLACDGAPMLGICFGSQIFPYAVCGTETVFRRPEGHEIGLIDLELSGDHRNDPLLRGLPPTLPVFSWHQDEIVPDHPGLQVLGRSAACGNHLWRYRDLPIWGIQAHPEAGGTHARRWLAQHAAALQAAGLEPDDPLWSSGFETPQALRLIDNFAAYVLKEHAA